MLKFKIFEGSKNLTYGISHKDKGSMESLNEKKKFLDGLGKKEVRFIYSQQIHGNKAVVLKNYQIKKIEDADVLITDIPKLYLTITVADCFPIYIYEPKNDIIALVHAGWRGISKGIIKNTINKLIKEYQVKKENLLVGIGPGIHKCHFEVKQEVLPKFRKFKHFILEKDNKHFISLPQILTAQLIASGIKNKNIEVLNECTYCFRNKYFSFRFDKKFNQIKRARPMLAFMALTKIL